MNNNASGNLSGKFSEKMQEHHINVDLSLIMKEDVSAQRVYKCAYIWTKEW